MGSGNETGQPVQVESLETIVLPKGSAVTTNPRTTQEHTPIKDLFLIPYISRKSKFQRWLRQLPMFRLIHYLHHTNDTDADRVMAWMWREARLFYMCANSRDTFPTAYMHYMGKSTRIRALLFILVASLGNLVYLGASLPDLVARDEPLRLWLMLGAYGSWLLLLLLAGGLARRLDLYEQRWHLVACVALTSTFLCVLICDPLISAYSDLRVALARPNDAVGVVQRLSWLLVEQPLFHFTFSAPVILLPLHPAISTPIAAVAWIISMCGSAGILAVAKHAAAGVAPHGFSVHQLSLHHVHCDA